MTVTDFDGIGKTNGKTEAKFCKVFLNYDPHFRR